MKKLIFLNKLKSLSLGLDALFKKVGIRSIKYHHSVSAVYQSVLSFINDNNLVALRKTVGDDLVDDKQTMDLMRDVLREFVDEFIAAGTDDQKLNRGYTNFKILDKDDRFPLRIEPISISSTFHGHLTVTDSFNDKAPLEVGKLVNVKLTINQDDSRKMIDIVKDQLNAIGLVIGRLTGTQDTSERHVSIALRLPYTADLGLVVEKINDEINNLTFTTAAKMKLVTPTDIRTSESAVELVSNDSCHILQELQGRLYSAAGLSGNKLPPLHITHGNSPIEQSSIDEITKLHLMTSKLDHVLCAYGLDLPAALSAHHEKLEYAHMKLEMMENHLKIIAEYLFKFKKERCDVAHEIPHFDHQLECKSLLSYAEESIKQVSKSIDSFEIDFIETQTDKLRLSKLKHEVPELVDSFKEAAQSFKLSIKAREQSAVCAAMPSTLFARVSTSAWNGTKIGFLKGATNSMERSLNSKGYSLFSAGALSQASFYSAYGVMKFGEYYLRMKAEDEIANITSGILIAACDTGNLLLISAAISIVQMLLLQTSQLLEKNQWHKSATTFRTTCKLLEFSIFAYHTSQKGIEETGASLLAGAATQVMVEKIMG